MTSLFKKNYLAAVLLALGICTPANAMEIRPLFQFDFPADVTINKRIESVKEEKTWETDPVFIIGSELLFSAEFAPIRYGLGIGFKSSQKDGSKTITPAFLPIWGNISFGLYKKDWFAVPYATARIGTMGALTGEGSWWERPFMQTLRSCHWHSAGSIWRVFGSSALCTKACLEKRHSTDLWPRFLTRRWETTASQSLSFGMTRKRICTTAMSEYSGTGASISRNGN